MHASPTPSTWSAVAAGLLLASCGGGSEVPASRWLTDSTEVALEPSGSFDAGGRLWVAWIAFRPGGAEPELLGAEVPDGGPPRDAVSLSGGQRDVAAPHLAPWDGGVYCVWEAVGPGGRGIYGRALPGPGPVERIGPPGRSGLVPRIARIGEDRLELVYQGSNGGDYDLFHCTRTASGWSEPRVLFDTPLDEWNPRVAAGTGGELHVVYDFFDGESFDVGWAVARGGVVERRRTVADGPAYQGLPDVAVDGEGSVWIAYEEARQFGESGGLRGERSVRLLRAGPEPRFAALAVPEEHPRAELPRVAAGPAGVVLSCRVLGESYVPEKNPRKAGNYTTFVTYAGGFDERGAPAGAVLAGAEGGNDATESLLVSPETGAAWCLFAADQRSESYPDKNSYDYAIEGSWRLGLRRLGQAWGVPRLATGAPETGRRSPPRPAPRRRGDAGPLFGDLHRHTNASRCAGAQDGLRIDVWRYARGPGALDFVAVTDHFQHLRPWSWWQTLRDGDRYHDPPQLVTLPGLERNVKGYGHQNLVFRDRAAARLDDPAWLELPVDLDGLELDELLAIPHMMSFEENPFAWQDFLPRLHRLVEVYQGNRGSFEGPGLPLEANGTQLAACALEPGLRSGRPFGLIAASDHSAASDGLAGVYARQRTREAVFAALQGRVAFASTGHAAVETRLGALAMGGQGRAGRDEPFEVRVPARAGDEPVPLAYVEVIKNGAPFARRGGGGELEVWVLTSRFRRARASRPLQVVPRRARIPWAHLRTPGESGAQVALDPEAGFELVLQDSAAGVVFAIEPTGPEPAGVEVRFLDQVAAVPLGAVEVGRSERLGGMVPELEHLWRLGPPLGVTEGEFTFPDPERRAGDAYYARVAWTDGTLAWSSPIWVTGVE